MNKVRISINQKVTVRRAEKTAECELEITQTSRMCTMS